MFSGEKQEEIQRQVEELLKINIIRPSQERQYSQVMLARKPNGKWRFCIDFRALNECTRSARWPIPKIDEMLKRMGAKRPKYFAVMNLPGNNQAELSGSIQRS